MKKTIFMIAMYLWPLALQAQTVSTGTPIPAQPPYIDTKTRQGLSKACADAVKSGAEVWVTNAQTGGATCVAPVRMMKGALLTSGSYTFSAGFESGDYQVFGSGSSVYGLSKAKLEWWGGGSSSDNGSAAISAVASLTSYLPVGNNPNVWSQGGGVISLGSGTYTFSSGFTLYQNMTLQCEPGTYMLYTGPTGTFITLDYSPVTGVTNKKAGITIRGCTIDAGGKGNVAIGSLHTIGLQDSYIGENKIFNAGIGILLDTGWDVTIYNNHVADVIDGIVTYTTDSLRGCNQNYIADNVVERFTRHGYFVTGLKNTLHHNNAQFALWNGTDTEPLSTLPTRTFPVGFEIFGQDSAGLGIGWGGTDSTQLELNYCEHIQASSAGTCIYGDNVDTSNGNALLKDTKIVSNNRFHSDVDRPIVINAAYKTRIAGNHYQGSTSNLITLQSPLAKQTTIAEDYYTLDDRSGGQYIAESYAGVDFKSISKLTVGNNVTSPTGIFRTAGTFTAGAAGQSAFTVSPIFYSQYDSSRVVDIKPTLTASGDLSSGTLYGVVSEPALTGGSYSVNTLIGSYFRTDLNSSYTGTVSTLNNTKIDSPTMSASVKPTTVNGILIANQGASGVNTSSGLKIAAQTGSTTNYAIQTSTGKVLFGDTVIHSLSSTPSSSVATCTAGQIAWDSSYLYQCVATNQWKRVAISGTGW